MARHSRECLLVQTGRRHLALRHYQALRAAVQREFDVEPEAGLQALYEDLRGGSAAQGAARSPLFRVVKEQT